MESKEFDLNGLEETIARVGRDRSRVITLLQALQSEHHYLPVPLLERLCELTDMTPAQVTGVSTFYSQFRTTPTGEHLVRVCHGTACHVKGADLVQDSLRRALGLENGADTDAEGRFTVEKVACLGCCTLAPVVQIGDSFYGHLTPESIPRAIHRFQAELESGIAPASPSVSVPFDNRDGEIRIGLGSCCVAKGSGLLRQALEKELAKSGARVGVKRVGCVGMCHRTPMVEVVATGEDSKFYAAVQPEEAKAIVARHFKPRGFFRRLESTIGATVEKLFDDEVWEPVERFSIEMRDPPVAAFLDRQVHIATEHFGDLNPFDLEEYKDRDGFKALESCLRERSPEKIIDEIQASGLRGRGGGGFPTGLKWAKVRESQSEKKYVVCNGDEGDPGAFMDRMLLESFPYRIIEGMAVAAYAVGADEGIFYIRAEYPLALRIVREAIRCCQEWGYLGDNILGTGVNLHLRVVEGAGAFVSGEETALLASLQGDRSNPSLRPPYPAEEGLWKKPTSINNVETYALVPWIFRKGAAAFARFGTEKSKGTKVFALAGKVARGGLVEVPMGMTLREIVEEIGGGIENDKRFKAVQVGGPSGGCVPAIHADTPVDYEALGAVGAIMGSGGLVVLDETDCMVDMARYFLEFTQNESCGKCSFCRIGTKRMLEILTRLCEGNGKPGDLERLEELAHEVKKGSFCGLGKTAPNPVLTTLEYFREEYEAHLERRCPARRCRALIAYSINGRCNGCTLCAQICPSEAIPLAPYQIHKIDSELCIECDMCRTVCPEDAVEVE